LPALRILADRRHRSAFVAGCVAVTAGVLLHLPMYWMGRGMGFHLAGMPMDAGMLWGMALIVAGVMVAGYGLLPRRLAAATPAHDAAVVVSAPEDAPLGPAHWRLMVVLTVALVIDVMKPASLGFVLPGMRVEYGVSAATVAWFPFSALGGTVVGSVLWGWLADLYGRRASILLSAVMFVGTSICGSMPSLWWNVGMCFLMGAAAGGMLPVTYALLAETMPTRQRGWALVLVGGLGAAGGYLAASAFSAWLVPSFSWRILWFLNLPTGLALIALNAFIPESPKFLLALGRVGEAHAVLRRFGCLVRAEIAPAARAVRSHAIEALEGLETRVAVPRAYVAQTVALSIVALAWGVINFGLLLWLPAHFVAKGYSMGVSSGLLAASALIAVPTVFAAAWLYSAWSSKGALVASIALCAAGLLGLVHLELARSPLASPVLVIAVLIVGVNGIIAMLLPYAAESYPLQVRGRATGWVAACTKAGGLGAQLLGLLGLVPGMAWAAVLALVPVTAAMVLVMRYCVETRGSDLRDLERQPG
jgi:putative MFS transporter